MTSGEWPPLPQLDTGDQAAYEWLLSAHPWAVAERDRRRRDHHARELDETGEVLAIIERLATLDEDHPLHQLAVTVTPSAQRRALEADVDDAEPDDTRTAEARRRLELHRRSSGDFDYVYPPELIDSIAVLRHPPPLPDTAT